MAEIESYAPMMAYLVRSMQTGGELARHLWQTMIRNVESYLDDGVRAGTIRPSRDPAARAKYIGDGQRRRVPALSAAARQPDGHLRGVLRDYREDMMMPALEVFTEGLLADSTMLETFAAQADSHAERARRGQ